MPSNYLPVPMSPLSGSAGRRQRSYPMMTRASSPVGPAPGYSQNSGSEQMTDPTVSGTTTPMPSRVTVRRTSAPMLGIPARPTGPAPGMFQGPSAGTMSPTVSGAPMISGGVTRLPSAPMLPMGNRTSGSSTSYPMAPTLTSMVPQSPAPVLANARKARGNADAAIAATKKPNVETQGRSGQVGESAIKEMWLNTAKGDVAKFAALGRKWGFNHEALLKKWEGEGVIFEHDVNNPNRPEPQYVARGEYPGKVYPARTPQQQQDVTERRLAYAKEQNAKADELEAQYATANAPPAQPVQPEDARVQVARINQETQQQQIQAVNDRAGRTADLNERKFTATTQPNEKPPTRQELVDTAIKIMANNPDMSDDDAMARSRRLHGLDKPMQVSGPPLNGGIALGGGHRVAPATQPAGSASIEQSNAPRRQPMEKDYLRFNGRRNPDGTMTTPDGNTYRWGWQGEDGWIPA